VRHRAAHRAAEGDAQQVAFVRRRAVRVADDVDLAGAGFSGTLQRGVIERCTGQSWAARVVTF
jgi:hypothetical protein